MTSEKKHIIVYMMIIYRAATSYAALQSSRNLDLERSNNIVDEENSNEYQHNNQSVSDMPHLLDNTIQQFDNELPIKNISQTIFTDTNYKTQSYQIQPTSILLALPSTTEVQNARQNSSPDIQDIITGIVKLLNGNVNVHANTQLSSRRPYTTRINNRGPPRISDVQSIAHDHELPYRPTSHRQPPYPFNKPDISHRPFLTGIPIPEQIVPSMQQNYRPDFISLNRPTPYKPRPWNINRRPVTGLNKLPTTTENQLDIDLDSTTFEPNIDPINENDSNIGLIELETSLQNTLIKDSLSSSNKISPTTILDKDFESTQIHVENNMSVLETTFGDKDQMQINNIKTPNLSSTPLINNMSLSTITSTIPVPTTSFKAFSTSHNVSYGRPGIVLDDTEYKPFKKYHILQNSTLHPTPHLNQPGYGEIFDITLSAVQGLSGDNSQQIVKIKNVNKKEYYNIIENDDIIISATDDNKYVSIDGKQSYFNLFDTATDFPHATSLSKTSILLHTTSPKKNDNKIVQTTLAANPYSYPKRQPNTNEPPLRIDTCIVGDDSTCDLFQNEYCRTEIGVSSCQCRPGFARRKYREPCRKVVSFVISLRVDKIYDKKLKWDLQFTNKNSEAYSQLSYESIRAINSAMSMTPFSDEFLNADVNNIYEGDPSQGLNGIFVNITIKLEENKENILSSIKTDIQKHLLGVIDRRNNNIGNSILYVETPTGAISNVQDLNECNSYLNDCHIDAICHNIWGGFRCECKIGLQDQWFDNPQRAGRNCISCANTYCNNRGACSFGKNNKVCACYDGYYGTLCDIDGEVVGVAVGASVAALLIIVLTLICLIMWSRRWHSEQNNSNNTPIFDYLSVANSAKTPQNSDHVSYQLTLEDRMRWAQVADVIAAQTNHYAVEPIIKNRIPAPHYGYNNLQIVNNGLSTLNTLGNASIASTLPLKATLPPIPLPRLGINIQSNKVQRISTSSEEDRADLLSKNFHASKQDTGSNASTSNQSVIYYDVDYEADSPMYNSDRAIQPPNIPMSTYTTCHPQLSYYHK